MEFLQTIRQASFACGRFMNAAAHQGADRQRKKFQQDRRSDRASVISQERSIDQSFPWRVEMSNSIRDGILA